MKSIGGILVLAVLLSMTTADSALEKEIHTEQIVKLFLKYKDIHVDADFLERLRLLLESQSTKRHLTKRSQPIESAERAELLRVVRQLRADKSSAELEAQQLRNRSENCEAEIHRIRAQHARDVERMRLEINTLDDDIANLRKLRREDIHDETIRSKKDKDTLLNEKERLHRHIVDITNKTIEIHQENLKLHMQINKLKQLNVVYSEDLEEKRKNVTVLEETNLELQQTMVKLQEDLEVCKEEKLELNRNSLKLNVEAERMRAENSGLHNASRSLRNELAEMTRTKLDLLAKFDAITDIKNKTASEIQTLHEKITNFTEESERKSRELTSSTSQLTAELTAQTRNVSSLVDNINKQLNCHRKVMDLGMVYLGGKHYFFSEKSFKKSWSESEEFCRFHGLELAGIESEEENDLIVEHLETKFSSSWSHHWVGLTDEAVEGNWVWSSSGQPITFSAWGRHLPGGGTLENCASVFRYSSSDFRWCDHPCQTKFPFVCEEVEPCS